MLLNPKKKLKKPSPENDSPVVSPEVEPETASEKEKTAAPAVPGTAAPVQSECFDLDCACVVQAYSCWKRILIRIHPNTH